MTRDELIENNLGLVHSCVKHFVGKGIEYDDLYSSGCVGLIKAIDNFDSSRGFRLSTYAVPVILGEIKRLFRDGGAVKISRSLKELSQKAIKICDEYKKQNGADIPISQLAEKLGVDSVRASEALCAISPTVSITAHTEDGEKELDIPTIEFEESVVDRLSLQKAISELDDNDKQLITLRYYHHKTQSQTAQMLNMTQVQISRKEKKILLSMRQKLT